MIASTPLVDVVFDAGRISARRVGPGPPYDPLVRAIEAIRDPREVIAAFDHWRITGETPGFIAGVDVASLYFEPDSVIAEVSPSTEDFEERIGYAAFEPILRSWQAAWDGRFA